MCRGVTRSESESKELLSVPSGAGGPPTCPTVPLPNPVGRGTLERALDLAQMPRAEQDESNPISEQTIPATFPDIFARSRKNAANRFSVYDFPTIRGESLLVPCLEGKFADSGQNPMSQVAQREKSLINSLRQGIGIASSSRKNHGTSSRLRIVCGDIALLRFCIMKEALR